MTTDYMLDVWPLCVERRYNSGGHMIAKSEEDITLNGETVHIEVGHRLTRDEARVFPGDVEHIWREVV